jgi:predicted nucleic acid-binding protein
VAKELQRPDTRFVAPAFLIEELTDHLEEYAEKAEVSEEELSDRIDAVAEAIDLVNLDALLPYADQELVKACDKIDPDDAPYFATYLAEDADLIWTSDKALREAFPDIARATLPVAGRPR